MDQIQRETMEVDVLIVGAGSAGLASAIQLKKNIDQHNYQLIKRKLQAETIPKQMIVVIEKAAEVGSHSFLGAVMY
ncbi:MAG: electron transfer flavoprotein-ubiquinone oxidoreductase, partial [Bdellovibrionales bacterium]|nr:electron transfer flavoprotein-ubiquinone oxidoreductase [Bdellovibrionales bacterium]